MPQDYVRAHMWMSLGITLCDDRLTADLDGESGRVGIDKVIAKMTPKEIDEADQPAREWLETHG